MGDFPVCMYICVCMYTRMCVQLREKRLPTMALLYVCVYVSYHVIYIKMLLRVYMRTHTNDMCIHTQAKYEVCRRAVTHMMSMYINLGWSFVSRVYTCLR